MLNKILFPLRVLLDAVRRFGQDDGFFLASGLAFNMLLCLLPFLLIAASLSGYWLESSQAAQQELLALVENAFPEATHELQESLLNLLQDREIIGVLGLLTLALAASRLFGGIRVVLKITYGHELDLNMITGKLFDMGMVVLTCALLLLSLGLSSVVTLMEELGTAWMAERGYDAGKFSQLAAHGFAYVFSAAMFFVMYRMPLPRRVPSSIVLWTALLVGLLWEMAKWLFEFYLSKVTSYDVLYGSFGVLVILILWINYTAIIFVIGAELGAAMLALRRKRGRVE
ncbi:YihY/virulence factor BrkB family protein [candidate division KSB1 bacterium]|nr:YihY/virulence factor BrkB family protein [candidate division KSB1 bacterium]